MCFSLETLIIVHHKDWLTILVELTDMVNSVIIFLSQMILLRWLTFLLRSLTLTVLLLDIFLSSDTSICSTIVFPTLGNSDHFVVSVSIDFPINSKQDAPFHCTSYDYGGRNKGKFFDWT